MMRLIRILLRPFSKFFEFHARTHYRAERHSMALTIGIIIAAGVAIIWRERQLGIERARARKAMTPQG